MILLLKNNLKLSISFNTYLDLGLKEGDDINTNEILKKEAYELCFTRAIALIKHKDYSIKNLKEILNKKFQKSIVNSVLIRLQELSLIDERSNVLNLINYYINKDYGPLKIKYELNKKGYPETYFKEQNFSYHIEFCANKYLKKYQGKHDIKVKSNLYRYLYSKGYSNDMILSYFKREEITYD